MENALPDRKTIKGDAMEQSDKHGVVQDDYLKHETQGLERSGRSTHVEEWADPEPSGEDQPMASLDPNGGLTGGVPSGMTPREVEERSLLARHLGKSIYPATRADIVAKLREEHAPSRFVDRVEQLPDGKQFENVQEIAMALGMHVETQRF
jgi:hypothetical protein